MMPLTSRPSNKEPQEAGNRGFWRFWREPLIHFFVLGLAVFGLHAALERKPEATETDPYLVEVSSADIEWIRNLFKKQMGREPTVHDLRGRVHQLIREQILSREAVAMGLDEGDVVVRRRLVQKMEFLFKDLSAMTEPTEDELRNYLAENHSKYEVPPQITFTQIYFNSDSRGIDEAKQAAQTMVAKNVDPNMASQLGDASMLPADCTGCSIRKVKDRFGNEFAEAIESLEPGAWCGPVQSAYGFHAVYIHESEEAALLDLNDVLDKVKNDWWFAKREESSQRVYGEIRSRYRVLVEGLPYDFDVKG
jgi:hypothetical protein